MRMSRRCGPRSPPPAARPKRRSQPSPRRISKAPWPACSKRPPGAAASSEPPLRGPPHERLFRLHHRCAAVARPVRGDCAAFAAADARRLPQPALPGDRAAHQPADRAAAAGAAADRQGRHRLRGRGAAGRGGGCRPGDGAAWRQLARSDRVAGRTAPEIAHMLLSIYLYAIILYALLSMIAPGGYSPLQSVLTSVCEPVLRPIRRLIPPIAGLDLSPLFATLIILALLNLPLMMR